MILAISLVLYFKCFISLLLTVVIHTLVKHSEANDLCVKSNLGELTLIAFLRKRPWTHVMNLISASLWLLLLPDVVRQFPKISIGFLGITDSEFAANIVHIIGCMIVGYFNSSLVLKLLGTGMKYVLDVIDKKTNIADGK